MKKEVAFKNIDEIRSYYPKSEQRGGVFVLSEMEASVFVVAPMWASEQKTDMLIAFELYLPTIPFLKQDRATEKLLKKAEKKLAAPRGFEVQANSNPSGGIDVWIRTVWNTPIDKQAFDGLAPAIHMVGIAVFKFLAYA